VGIVKNKNGIAKRNNIIGNCPLYLKRKLPCSSIELTKSIYFIFINLNSLNCEKLQVHKTNKITITDYNMSLFKYTIEYPIKTSISILYRWLSNPSELSEWFADNVNIRNDVLTFYWDGSEQKAIVLKNKKDESIRYQWIDDQDTERYFEFLIQVDEMTKDVSLIITDFAEDEEEKEEGLLLWDTQIDNLKHSIGI